MERTRLFLRVACCFPKSITEILRRWLLDKVYSSGAALTGFKAGLAWCRDFQSGKLAYTSICGSGLPAQTWSIFENEGCLSWLGPLPLGVWGGLIICQRLLFWSFLLTSILRTTCSVLGWNHLLKRNWNCPSHLGYNSTDTFFYSILGRYESLPPLVFCFAFLRDC